jgi:GntR family transcriptional regulator
MPRTNLVPLSPQQPLYRLIKHTLRARILDGTYAPHSQMPSDHGFCEIFEVSRITVRRARSDLQKERLMFRVHGKGTYVSNRKAFQNVTSWQGFAEAMSSMGHEIVNPLRHFAVGKANRQVAEKLGVPEGSPLPRFIACVCSIASRCRSS